MISRDGFPICAKNTNVTIAWTSTGPNNLELVNAHLAFDNINVTTAGPILKERTSLGFSTEDPIPWGNVPTG